MLDCIESVKLRGIASEVNVEISLETRRSLALVYDAQLGEYWLPRSGIPALSLRLRERRKACGKSDYDVLSVLGGLARRYSEHPLVRIVAICTFVFSWRWRTREHMVSRDHEKSNGAALLMRLDLQVLKKSDFFDKCDTSLKEALVKGFCWKPRLLFGS